MKRFIIALTIVTAGLGPALAQAQQPARAYRLGWLASGDAFRLMAAEVRALGLGIPPALLARADAVIE